MKITENIAGGYILWLSKNDTFRWTHKPGAIWPNSELSHKAIKVVVDKAGLVELTVNGKPADADNIELTNCISDHLPEELKKYWPCWKGI